MMRRGLLVLLVLALGGVANAAPNAPVPPVAPSAPRQTEAGVMSSNVEHITTVNLEQGTATGAKVVGDRLYVTSWKSFSIYDISKPAAPTLLSRTPLGFAFENENVSTDGRIMLFAEQVPVDRLHVWDVRNGENPVEISTLTLGGTHTATCALRCRWSYGSYDFVGPDGAMTGGQLVDLRNPAKPKDAGHYNTKLPAKATHDVVEIARGRLLTASKPIQLLDVRDNPRKPKLLATGTNTARRMHSAVWPQRGEDRFIMTTFETNGEVRCSQASGEFSTWDTRGWRNGRKFRVVDQYRVANGTYMDGRPAANQLGCSAHWFEEHPSFADGGMVASAFYEHGVRFLDISDRGTIREVGYFMGWGGSASAAYWVTDSILYSIDYTRGIDVLRFKRGTRRSTTAEVSPSTWSDLASAAAIKPSQLVCRVGA